MQFKNPRKLVLWCGLAIFIIGLFAVWRALHPPLTPEEQIKANTEDLRQRIENRDVGGVSGYFSKDFTYNGSSRKDLIREMQMAFFEGRDVQVHISNEQVKVNGESAVSSGHYSVSFRPGPNASVESHPGEFQLTWAIEDGQWKVASVKGGIDIGGF